MDNAAKHITIAVDGPSGAGKSTVCREVAKRLGIVYLDTGAMYRALGLKALRLGTDPNDREGVLGFLYGTAVEIAYEGGEQQVLLDGENVSTAIRNHEVSRAASDISKIREVRLKMVSLQRGIAAGKDVIMDGRDIGTYVLPDAKLKFYLDAKPEERARRRHLELESKGAGKPYAEVLKDIISRDANDSGRDFAPLKVADGATVIDSTDMTFEEVVSLIIQRAER